MLFLIVGLVVGMIVWFAQSSPYTLSGVRTDGDAQDPVTLTMTSTLGHVETLTVLHGTSFTFKHNFKTNEGYAITASDTECTITNGSGTFTNASIANVVVECNDPVPTLACVNQTGVIYSTVDLLLNFTIDEGKTTDLATITVDGVAQTDLVVTDMTGGQYNVADVVFPSHGVFTVSAQLYDGTSAVSGESADFTVFVSDQAVPVITSVTPGSGTADIVGTFGSDSGVELFVTMDPDTAGCNVVAGGPYLTTAGGAYTINLTGIEAGEHDFVVRGETGANEKTGSSLVDTATVT